MSVVGKPGYSETPVGWMPLEWGLGAVSNYVASLQAGVSVNAVETESGCSDDDIGVLKTSAACGGKFFPAQHKVVVAEDIGRVTTPVLADRVIISRMNTPALVGESGYVVRDYPCLFLPDRLWQTVPSNRPHSQRWLSYWLQLPSVRRLIAAGATGTSNSMKNISKDVLLSLPAPLTPLHEQQKIAAILTAVDDKLDVIARQIETTQTLKRGLMQTLFSRGVGTQDAQGRWQPHTEFQSTELGEIPAGWAVQKLASISKEDRDRNGGRLDDSLLFGVLKEQGLVPMRDRVKGISTDRCRVVKPNAFAYNPMRINIGSIARNLDTKEVMVSPDYVVFSACPDKLLPSFLDHFRRSGRWELFVGGSGDGSVRIRIYYADLAELRLPLPPVSEQKRIVEILDGVDAKLDALASKQTHYQTLKRGLMQKLLTGEWRVKVDSAVEAAKEAVCT